MRKIQMFNLFPQDPVHHLDSVDWKSENGMELRDYFASIAISRCLELCGTNTSAAEEAYLIADAMLKAREKQ